MPIYPCKCELCGDYQEPIRPAKDYDKHPHCCGQQMVRVITAPYVAEDIKPYKSVTGEMITSRKQHKEFLKKNGLVEIGNEKITPKKKQHTPNSDEIKRELYAAMSN